MEKEKEIKKEIIRINGKLKEIITVKNKEGRIIHRMIAPLKVEFKLKDVLEITIGSVILAVPVAFTEETWVLGSTLPMVNVLLFLMLSLIFITTFNYYNLYKNRLKKHWFEFIKRVGFTYLISFMVVGFVLFLIQQANWFSDFLLAFKRTLIVSFPASMSASITDTIK
jgi:uncharacterized membrane protein